jgi:hypothetical protein
MFLDIDNSLSTRQAATGAAVVVVSADLTRGPEGVASCTLYVGGAGDVTVTTADGDSVTFTAVPAGTFLPIQVTQVSATTVGAGLIIALY